ncbi:autotransporter family protein [Pseudomonas huanghezhanensis]|uniref:autotransporter family protein n=1 Tax=Pseudomonas huanghezhanensis TaxID=3002903 RepID=UPI002285FE22|nr:autotransporter outer membrane beta-barrel domain-containing protein [Pseudomonas sp. BSw22131]
MTAPSTSQSACNLVSSLGGDTQICDSGSSGPLTNPSGNNVLIFPAGGTGSIVGSVTFGPGNDRIEMSSGSIVGDFNQGAGTDQFRITQGTITGDVNQSFDPDSFFMSGGTLRSLTQGDGFDTFLMTGGTITNAFEDGDSARMTGGTIGRVDMKLDNNLFDMSGGTIVNNLVTGFGKDTIIMSGGLIGGAISVSGGNDSITFSGGEVRGGVRASFGDDVFIWREGGFMRGGVMMADGADRASLFNLTEANLASNPLLDGGAGIDVLSFDAVSTSVPGRYINWESVNLNNGSQLDLAGHFVLGDSVTGTGVFNVDASSIVRSTAGSFSPFTGSQLATLNNAGTLDMTTGSTSATDTLTVRGNYVGNNGRLLLQSVLAGDDSPSDKLVVAGGALSGTTQIEVTHLGGQGAFTAQNGIQVVQASDGAISDNGAFSLNGSLSAGAYQYYLFKGGVQAGTENNWYLRSAVLSLPLPPAAAPVVPVVPVAPPAVTPAPPPVTPPEVPVPPVAPPVTPTPPSVTPQQPSAPSPVTPAAVAPVAAIGTPALPAPVQGSAPIPLYRQEVPDYSVLPPAVAVLLNTTLGTFHDRQGDQSLLDEHGAVPAGWGRILSNDFKQGWSGTVNPKLDASIKGYQIGHDLYAAQTSGGSNQRLGLFVAHSRMDGHVQGFADGFEQSKTGNIKLEGDSAGAYWTFVGPSAGYLDAVVMGTRLDGYSRSNRGLRIDTKGHALSLSLEAGYPITLSPHWVIEPQVQFIHQRIDLEEQNDGIADVSFDSDAYNTGRVGARFKGSYVVRGVPVEPYVRTNLWRTLGGKDTVTFDHVTRIESDHQSTTADLGVGFIATLGAGVSVYAGADYHTDVDDNDLNGVIANIGVRVSW